MKPQHPSLPGCSLSGPTQSSHQNFSVRRLSSQFTLLLSSDPFVFQSFMCSVLEIKPDVRGAPQIGLPPPQHSWAADPANVVVLRRLASLLPRTHGLQILLMKCAYGLVSLPSYCVCHCHCVVCAMSLCDVRHAIVQCVPCFCVGYAMPLCGVCHVFVCCVCHAPVRCSPCYCVVCAV